MPPSLVDALVKGGGKLQVLELDWWAVSVEDWNKIAKVCINVERLKITLDAPFAKLVR